MKTVLALAIYALTFAACGSPTLTRGEACDRVSAAACQRTAACTGESYNGCVAATKASCCTGSACDETEVNHTEMWVDACSAAFGGESCADVAAGAPPAVCTTTK